MRGYVLIGSGWMSLVCGSLRADRLLFNRIRISYLNAVMQLGIQCIRGPCRHRWLLLKQIAILLRLELLVLLNFCRILGGQKTVQMVILTRIWHLIQAVCLILLKNVLLLQWLWLILMYLEKFLCLRGGLVWWILGVPNDFRGRISFLSQDRIRKG